MSTGASDRGRIVVVGGGAVGLAFAAASGDEVRVLESGPPRAAADPEQYDIRVYALSEGTRSFLREIDAWRRMPAGRMAAVGRMEIFGDDGTSRLEFTPPAGRALAWIVEGNRLSRAIEEAARDRGATISTQSRLRSIAARPGGAAVVLEDETVIGADLLVGADGADSWVRGELGLAVQAKRYAETAVVAHFRCERPPAGVARQWFRPDGILAWLPLPGERMSIVWSARDGLAKELAALDPEAFARRVRDAGGAALGDLALDSAIARFPLRLVRVPRITVPGAVLIGDAAHGVHPLAGQGVNLGFQDARNLARTLGTRSPLERPGDFALLRRHERERRAGVDAMQFVTDRLEWLFRIDASVAGLARNAGLRAVDAAPAAKRLLAARAMR
ncbi:MAG TPA: FAD-dependent monooxygenase [Usitatibacteraceae bacterium]|nr:FAD-dependent monooxygenase [Usitatibacteraceae bacterium]